MATIFCFTSTGNSLFTAKKLAEKINGKVMPMNNGAIQTEDNVIGFVFPVYFWGLPHMVEQFVSSIKITSKDAYIFAVSTSGGPGFGEFGQIKKILQTKGIPLRYAERIISVSNYIPEFTPKDSKELRQKINKRIDKIAEDIQSQRTNQIQGSTFLNKIVYHFYPSKWCDNDFTLASTCTGCGICQKVCPAKNIKIVNGQPAFLNKCEHCIACVHHCPSKAIDWKEKTKGKVRFRNAEISLDELISFHNHSVSKE